MKNTSGLQAFPPCFIVRIVMSKQSLLPYIDNHCTPASTPASTAPFSSAHSPSLNACQDASSRGWTWPTLCWRGVCSPCRWVRGEDGVRGDEMERRPYVRHEVDERRLGMRCSACDAAIVAWMRGRVMYSMRQCGCTLDQADKGPACWYYS